MLCIKKNKCFSTVLLLSQKKQTAYCNPFRPVETRSDLLKPVETRFNPFRLTRLNLSKHVQTCWNTLQSVQTRFPSLPSSIPPSPPSSPFSPFFFFGGGGAGGGGWATTTTPPPPPDFNNKKTIKILSLFLLQNLCNLPTLKVSLSPLLLLKTT
jgi:hypothetical protein